MFIQPSKMSHNRFDTIEDIVNPIEYFILTKKA